MASFFFGPTILFFSLYDFPSQVKKNQRNNYVKILSSTLEGEKKVIIHHKSRNITLLYGKNCEYILDLFQRVLYDWDAIYYISKNNNKKKNIYKHYDKSFEIFSISGLHWLRDLHIWFFLKCASFCFSFSFFQDRSIVEFFYL